MKPIIAVYDPKDILIIILLFVLIIIIVAIIFYQKGSMETKKSIHELLSSNKL